LTPDGWRENILHDARCNCKMMCVLGHSKSLLDPSQIFRGSPVPVSRRAPPESGRHSEETDMDVMLAYDNSRNARIALAAVKDLLGR
jgi:hypothetical protein